MFAIRVFVLVALIAWALDLIRQSLAVGELRSVVSAASGYPIWILAATALLLAAVLAFEVLPASRRGTDSFSQKLPSESSDKGRLVAFLLLWIGYVAALPVVGFLVSTAIATALSVKLLDRGARWSRVIIGAIVFTLVVQVLFRTVFFVLLPGSFIDEWLDSLFY